MNYWRFSAPTSRRCLRLTPITTRLICRSHGDMPKLYPANVPGEYSIKKVATAGQSAQRPGCIRSRLQRAFGPRNGRVYLHALWDYYDFTRDIEILKNVSYPVIAGMADFLSGLSRKKTATFWCCFPPPEQYNPEDDCYCLPQDAPLTSRWFGKIIRTPSRPRICSGSTMNDPEAQIAD